MLLLDWLLFCDLADSIPDLAWLYLCVCPLLCWASRFVPEFMAINSLGVELNWLSSILTLFLLGVCKVTFFVNPEIGLCSSYVKKLLLIEELLTSGPCEGG